MLIRCLILEGFALESVEDGPMIQKSKTAKRFIKQILISATLSALVACAGTGVDTDNRPAARSDCISQSSIRGYTVLDDSNLIISASARRQYHVLLQRRAYGLRSNRGIAFESPTSRICSSFSEVIFIGHHGGEPIRIAAIRALSPEEEEDLLIRYGKKEPEFERTPVPREVEGAEVEELDPVADDESSAD